MFDVAPTLPLPKQWNRSAYAMYIREDAAVSMASLRAAWDTHLELRQETEWLDIFEEMKTFSHDSFESSESTTAVVQHFAGEVGAWTNATIHKLLTFRPASSPLSFRRSYVMLEACRLGGLLYMVPSWRYFGVAPVSSEGLQTSLHRLLENDDVAWGGLWTLQLWILYMGAVEALDGPLEDWFLRRMLYVCLMNGIGDWDGGMAVVELVLWFACVFGQKHVALEEKMIRLFRMHL